MPGALRREKRKALRSGQILRYLLWTAAPLTSRPPELMVLNEPETSLHPDLLPALARLILTASAHTHYEVFRTALNRSSALAVRLTEALCLRGAEAERRIRVLAVHDAKKRLATLLHQMATAKQTATSAHNGIVSIRVSHAELAAQASLTRPHTTLIMTRFKKAGCLTYDRGTAIRVNMEQITSLIG